MFPKYSPLLRFRQSMDTIKGKLLKSCFSSMPVLNAQENILRSKLAAAPSCKGLTIPELIRSQTGNWGNRTAYECAVTGLKFTHNEVHKYSKGFGAALLKLGLKRGDVAIILLPNCPQYAPVLQGMLDTGIIAAPMNPALTTLEISKLAARFKAKAVVTVLELLPLVRAIQEECASVKYVISAGKPVEDTHNFFEMIKADPSEAEFLDGSKIDTSNEPAVIMSSSGTTGLPKGVVLTHNNIVSNMIQMTVPGLGDYDNGNDTFMGLAPIFHIAGMVTFGLLNSIVGGTIVTMPKMDPAVFTQSFRNHKYTMVHVVPPLLAFVATNPEITKMELESVRTVICGAAPTPTHLVHRLLEKTGKYTFYQEVYGLTETSGISVAVTPGTKNTKISSVGTVIPSMECKVIDVETAEPLGSNKNGELCFRGEQIMNGYLDNEEATRDAVDEDGWLHTGDIGYYDDQEYFYIVGRTKELIKVKGFQVAPSELEEVLGKHPQIVDVAVIGIPDDRAGELPRAYVVRKDTDITAENINNYLQDKVSEYKKLKGGIEFVDSIPKSAAGKILRKDLQLLYKTKCSK